MPSFFIGSPPEPLPKPLIRPLQELIVAALGEPESKTSPNFDPATFRPDPQARALQADLCRWRAKKDGERQEVRELALCGFAVLKAIDHGGGPADSLPLTPKISAELKKMGGAPKTVADYTELLIHLVDPRPEVAAFVRDVICGRCRPLLDEEEFLGRLRAVREAVASGGPPASKGPGGGTPTPSQSTPLPAPKEKSAKQSVPSSPGSGGRRSPIPTKVSLGTALEPKEPPHHAKCRPRHACQRLQTAEDFRRAMDDAGYPSRHRSNVDRWLRDDIRAGEAHPFTRMSQKKVRKQAFVCAFVPWVAKHSPKR